MYRVRDYGHYRKKSGTFGSVPHSGLRECRRVVRAARCRVPRNDPHRGLCRRGCRPFPLRRHDARCRFRATSARVPATSADWRAGGRDIAFGAGILCRFALGCKPRYLADNHRADTVYRQHHQHRSAWPGPLHPLRLFLPSRRTDSSRRDDWRHRVDAAPQAEGQAPEHRGAGGAHQGDCDRDRQGTTGAGGVMSIGLGHYLTVGAILFTLGIFGIFLNRKNVIIIMMAIELILLAVNINLVAFSAFLGDLVGQIYALLVLTVAAAEAAIGLAILVVYFRNRGSIAVGDINLMKG